MLNLKKYFTEGLIQMAILLSLCGVMVDVGLEPYLPPSWHEMIRGPTSALTQTQFHNLRNRLEDGQDLHPKSVDLDGFFTARRLLGWVRSLDRLQVPHAELETWLVQRESDPLPVGHPDQIRNRPAPPADPRPAVFTLREEEVEEEEETHHFLHHSGALEEEEEEEEEEQLVRHYRRTGGGRRPGRANRELAQDEVHQNADVDTLFDHNWNLGPTGTLQGVGSEALHPNCNHDDAVTDPDVLLTENPLQQGFLGHPSQSQLEPTLLSLTPSADLDDHSPASNTRGALESSNVNPLRRPSHPTDLPAEYPSEEFSLGLNAEDNSNTFNINQLTKDLVEMEGGSSSQYAPYPENPSAFNNFHLFDKEDNVYDEDGLFNPLDDLLEDASILDDIRYLDLALGEGFSPDMAARLEEEGYLEHEVKEQQTGRDDNHSGSSMAITEDQDQPRRHQQDNEDVADSDSGLSLNFSHSPASPYASEASSYSSSSSSSSSSCMSAVGSPFSDDEDGDDEERSVGLEMEVEVTIKQEELEEEEMGAVGGGYPADDDKPFAPYFADQKMFNGFPWMEHIGHDHTYNQPWSSPSSPSRGKMPTKHSKSIPRHDNAKPYHRTPSRHISDTKMWGRDERRARALKVPFSNDLIVNLPVDDFNDLLAKYQLSEEQLTLVRDIRRRGKNKIAAQNCRKRKLDVLLGLKDNVSGLRRYRSQLLRERKEAMRNLQEMKRQMDILYQDVFSRLRDEEGRPLDAMEYLLHFESNGSVSVASHQQGAANPLTKTSKKQRDKKK